jgi:hypothetical protein
MDPLLRDAVNPEVRDEDISPGYRTALFETACLCFCNVSLELERAEGTAAGPQSVKFIDRATQLAEVKLGKAHPLTPLLQNFSFRVQQRYGKERVRANMSLFTYERNETAMKLEKIQELAHGSPLPISLPTLVDVTDMLEKTAGSSFTGGIKPLIPSMEEAKRMIARGGGKNSRKSRLADTLAAASKEKPRNPFVFFEDAGMLSEEKRKWLYPNDEYVAHRMVDFTFRRMIVKQMKEMMTNVELYETATFHSAFSRLFYSKKEAVRKAAEEVEAKDRAELKGEDLHQAKPRKRKKRRTPGQAINDLGKKLEASTEMLLTFTDEAESPPVHKHVEPEPVVEESAAPDYGFLGHPDVHHPEEVPPAEA